MFVVYFSLLVWVVNTESGHCWCKKCHFTFYLTYHHLQQIFIFWFQLAYIVGRMPCSFCLIVIDFSFITSLSLLVSFCYWTVIQFFLFALTTITFIADLWIFNQPFECLTNDKYSAWNIIFPFFKNPCWILLLLMHIIIMSLPFPVTYTLISFPFWCLPYLALNLM